MLTYTQQRSTGLRQTISSRAKSLDSFESWLSNGLGRAVTFLASNPVSPYREAVLHACLHNVTYDSQSEERREPYLWTLIEHAGDRKLFHDAILDHLKRPPSEPEEFDWPQIFYVALRFAIEGDSEMRQAMYSAFDSLGFDTAGIRSATSLITIDAWDGFVFAIDRIDRSDP